MRTLAVAGCLGLAIAMPLPATVPPTARPLLPAAPSPARTRGGRELPAPTTAPGQSARRRRRLARRGRTV